MKSTAKIYMDFQNAKAQADQLDQLSRNLRAIGNDDLADCMVGISSNWKGDNAERFLQKAGQVKDKIDKTADHLAMAAQTIREIADNTYQAEMQAAELADQKK